MKNNSIIFLIFAFTNILYFSNNLFSQNTIATSVINNPKSLFVNPALSPEGSKFLSLPLLGGLSANFNNSFSFSDITEKNGNSYYLNSNEFIKVLSNASSFSAAKYSIDIFHIGIPVGFSTNGEHCLS